MKSTIFQAFRQHLISDGDIIIHLREDNQGLLEPSGGSSGPKEIHLHIPALESQHKNIHIHFPSADQGCNSIDF